MPKWVMLIGALAFLMIFGAVLWTSSANGPSTNKIDTGSYPAPLGSGPKWAPERNPVTVTPMDPPAPPLVVPNTPPTAPAADIQPRLKPLPVAPARPKARVQVTAAPASPLRGMFPMGNVVRQLPEVEHPFRQVAELFPSFEFGGRMWEFTGRYAYDGQVNLVPVGRKIDDRDILALANTAGPGSVLFVQSAQNPVKYAVYRRA